MKKINRRKFAKAIAVGTVGGTGFSGSVNANDEDAEAQQQKSGLLEIDLPFEPQGYTPSIGSGDSWNVYSSDVKKEKVDGEEAVSDFTMISSGPMVEGTVDSHSAINATDVVWSGVFCKDFTAETDTVRLKLDTTVDVELKNENGHVGDYVSSSTAGNVTPAENGQGENPVSTAVDPSTISIALGTASLLLAIKQAINSGVASGFGVGYFVQDLTAGSTLVGDYHQGDLVEFTQNGSGTDTLQAYPGDRWDLKYLDPGHDYRVGIAMGARAKGAWHSRDTGGVKVNEFKIRNWELEGQ